MSDAQRGVECTVIGRIVWGHPLKREPVKDTVTRQPKLDKTGKPMMQYAFGLAIPKDVFQTQVWPSMWAEISKRYPQGQPPHYALKYKDGDGMDREGKSYAQREGYPGHMVLTITSQLEQPPPLWKSEGGQWVQMGANEIKTGDYVQAVVEFKDNGATGSLTPGLYVNPQGLIFAGYGAEIRNVPAFDPAARFGAAAPVLAPGASATPLAPVGAGAPPGMPGYAAPAPAGIPQNYQTPGYAPPAGGYAPTPAPAPQPAQMPAYGAPQGYAAPAPAPQPGYPPQQPAAAPVTPAYDMVQAAGYGGPVPGQPVPQMPGGAPGMPGGAPGMPGSFPGMPPR